MNYVYQVVYNYRKGINAGLGAMTLYRQNPIDCEAEVVSATDYIKEYTDSDAIIIVNFILLNTEGR